MLTITPDLTGLPAWVTYDPATGILGGTPPVDNAGPVVVPVTVDDGAGGTFVGTVTITPVNPGPDAVDDTQAVGPVTPTTVTFLANDTDPDGDPLTVTAASLVDPSQGTLTQQPDGSWQFTSTFGVSGPVLINYTITDQDGATDSAVHTVDVGNVPPTLIDPDPTPGTPSIDPGNPNNLLVPAVDNVPVAVDLDDYFTDPNTGDVLTITPDLTGLPAWVTYNPATGVLGGTPPVDNAGPVVVPVTVDDGAGGTFTGTITITPVNPGPDAVDDTQAVVPETATALTLLTNDTDPDGDPLTVTAASLVDPTQGTLTQQPDGSWQFTSAPGVSGPVLVNYTITDQDGATDSAVHTVNVANQPPEIIDPDPTPGTPSIDPGNPNNLLVPAVDNVPVAVDLDDYFTDPNTGDVLTITPDLTGLPAWVTYDPATGILGGTPPVDNAGPVVVPVTVDDGAGGTFTGTITITPVNPPPDAVDDTQAALPETATPLTLLANDTDPDGDPLTVTTATLADPTQGTLTQLPDGSYSFTSAPGVSGPVLVNYTITDQDGATDSAVHTVNVANQPPEIIDPDPTPGTPSIDPGNPNNLLVPAVDNVPVAVDLDDYFTDPNTGDVLTITPDLTGLPAWVTYDPATGILGGTPPVDNAGPVVVPVTVDDGAGGTFVGTVTITPVNPGPDAVDDTQAVGPVTPTTVTFLANDTDPDGDPLTVTAASLVDPSQGTLTQQPDGSWQFTSTFGVSGPVLINYTITDQDGATDSAVHTVDVGNVPPTLIDPDPTPGTPSIDPGNPNNLLVPAVDNVPVAVRPGRLLHRPEHGRCADDHARPDGPARVGDVQPGHGCAGWYATCGQCGSGGGARDG